MVPYEVKQLKQFKDEITRFMMKYKFALNEMETKVEILQEEFQLLHDYNPIEHTKSRLKSPESILNKMYRKGVDLTFSDIKNHIRDIAGIRITCSFISDIYRISDMLARQSDITIIEVEDYIKNPKPNGYQSLHLIVQVPVFMSDHEELVYVEIQIRTIAMDFWASLEHKIYYKYSETVPENLLTELKEAAQTASALDQKMERIHREIKKIKEERSEISEQKMPELVINNTSFPIPEALFQLMGTKAE